MKKILIIRLGAIGDVVHSTVIQQALKKKHPDTEISFLTSELLYPLLKNDPDLDKVYKFNSKLKDNWFYILKLGLEFRKEKFDAIINLSNSLRNKVLLFLANPKKIISRSKHRVHATDAFFNSAKEVFDDIEKPTNLKLHLNKDILNEVTAKLEKYKRPFIVISPGGEHDNVRQGRIWPEDSWIELGNKLAEKYLGTIFIIGSKEERAMHEKYTKIYNSVLFSGELSLEESACLISLADLFISGDSGPLHMASALGVKTLGLMGSTPAAACGPYGTKGYSITSDTLCIGCGQVKCSKVKEDEKYSLCMKLLKPEAVFKFIEEKNLL